jgi:CheY-like chemotaxis protein
MGQDGGRAGARERGDAMQGETRVLVVDDDPDIRDVVALVLEDEGYVVDVAANGAEALRIVRANPPSGILLDMMMPIMDGPAFLRAIESEPIRADVPIVVMSASHKAAESVPVGAARFLAKPFDVEELLDVVEATFAGRRAGLAKAS